MQGQKVLLEKTGSQLEQELPDFQLHTLRRDLREESLEEPSPAGGPDQLSPHPWEKSPLLQQPAPKPTGTGNYCATLLPVSAKAQRAHVCIQRPV